MTTKTFAPKTTALGAPVSNKAPEKLTTMRDKSRTNTGALPPVNIRLTPDDRLAASTWLAELQGMTKKNITRAKLIRGLLHMQGKIDNEQLLLSILENT
ncbi:MAG: hypothetical protein K2W88_00775 [Pararheinheimera sp.]|nr:hypothetical protein [Rheinheimera sp.]